MPITLEEERGRAFEALDEEECFTLIDEGSFGRVAVCQGEVAAVFPVIYHALNRAIYLFTAKGTKLDAATRGATVSFEIDHFDAEYHHGWSVLVVGVAKEVHEPLIRELAAQLPLQPWAPGSRGHLVQIWPEFVSGRRITFSRRGPGGG